MITNSFAFQAQPAWMRHAYSKLIVCFFLLGFGYIQYASAQEVIVVVEDLQKFSQDGAGGINTLTEDETSYQLSIYIGLPPGDPSNLKRIDKVEVFDENGDLVYEESSNQRIISIPLHLLGNGDFEFQVFVGSSILIQTFTISE